MDGFPPPLPPQLQPPGMPGSRMRPSFIVAIMAGYVYLATAFVIPLCSTVFSAHWVAGVPLCPLQPAVQLRSASDSSQQVTGCGLSLVAGGT